MLVSFTESHCFHQSLYGLMDYRNNNLKEKVSSDWLDTNGSEATSKEARVRWLLYTHVTMISAENFRISL